MRNKNHSRTGRHTAHTIQALDHESDIPDGQHLIENQHIWTQRTGDGKPEANTHSRRIILHRHIDEFPDLGKVDDLVDLPVDFLFRKAQHRAVDVDVFPSRQNRVEPRPQRNQRPHPPPHRNLPRIRLDQPIEHLQKRRLPRPIVTNQAEAFPAPQFETDVVHRPKFAIAKGR